MPKFAKPIFPNAGVEAWYRDQLQAIVNAMSKEMLSNARLVWKQGGGFATDAAPLHHAAGIIFRSPQGRILLCHRTDGTGWAYPGGGVEPWETPEQAARRECWEELRYVGHGEFQAPMAYPLEWLHIRDYRNVRFATFLCDVPSEFSPVLNDEHSAARWITPEGALRDLKMHPGAKETLAEMLGWDKVETFGFDAKKKPTTSLLMQRMMRKWGLQWNKRLDTASERIAKAFATKSKQATEKAMMKQLADAGFTIKFKPTKRIRTAYEAVVAENVGLIRSIPQKYLWDVQNVIWQGVMNGSDMNAMAEQLVEKYGIAWRRAALIARDQNHKAKAAIEKATRLDNGITRAKWRHSHAGVHPRPTHVKMDGESYDIREGMYDPAVDKRIWPGTEVNCRCTDQPEIPGFDI